MSGVIFDAGGLVALERADRRVVVLLQVLARSAGSVLIPASVLAQVARDLSRQAMLARLIRQKTTDVVPLDRTAALAVGKLLAASRTSDVVDAHVVVCARRRWWSVVTSDPDDLRRLDPQVRLVAL